MKLTRFNPQLYFLLAVLLMLSGPARSAQFNFSFTFNNPSVNATLDANGGRFGSLSYDGPASAGVFSWSGLSNLAMSFTLGSDLYMLSDLLDPLTAIEMTIVDNGGGVFQITGIEDTAGTFAQFGNNPTMGFTFPGTGIQFAFSDQAPGQPGGTYLALDTTAVPLPATVWLFASGLLGFTLLGRHRNS